MKNNIWKMCVVGLMIASPIVCAAATDPVIAEALAAPGDGKYVTMGNGSQITLDFGTLCNGTDPAIILCFAQLSGGISIDFLRAGASLGSWDGSMETHSGQETAYFFGGSFDSVVITAYPDTEDGEYVYLDAVWGVKVENDVTTYVRPATDDPAVLIWTLIGDIELINATNGIVNSLDAKLDAALNALDDLNENNDGAAINSIEAFQNFCIVQSGRQIPEDEAAYLWGEAEKILTVLNLP